MHHHSNQQPGSRIQGACSCRCSNRFASRWCDTSNTSTGNIFLLPTQQCASSHPSSLSHPRPRVGSFTDSGSICHPFLQHLFSWTGHLSHGPLCLHPNTSKQSRFARMIPVWVMPNESVSLRGEGAATWLNAFLTACLRPASAAPLSVCEV
jgi:hypothetical protein